MAKKVKDVVEDNIKLNSVADLINRVNKKVGPGTIMTGEHRISNVDFISTGIAVLDAATGGGIPRGRIIEIFGAEGSGKTTTTLEIVASCQRTYFEDLKRNGRCAFIDAEHSLDPVWAKNVGVNMDEILLNQPQSGEEVFIVIKEMVKSGLVDLIVVDSVAAMIAKDELEGEISDSSIGSQARLMSKGLRMIKSDVNESKTAVIFINQIRNKIGVSYGMNPETTPGGLALKFYSSLRIDLRRGITSKVGDKSVAVECRSKIIKNKVAPPYCSCIYIINFGNLPNDDGELIYGVDKVGCLFDAGVINGVIEQNGSWYSFDSNNIGLGRDKSIATIRDNKELAANIRKAIAGISLSKVDLSKVNDDEFTDNISDSDGENKEDDLTMAVDG